MTSNLKNQLASLPYICQFIFTEFNKPRFTNVFFLNKELLLYQAKTINFDKMNWNNNIFQFCQDTYGIQYIHPVISLVNNIGSIFEFNSEKLPVIISPKITTIQNIVNKGSYYHVTS